MNVTRIDSPDGMIFTFHGQLTVENADSLKALLMEPAPGDRLSLDFTGVTAVDVAGLQLLCAAHRAWLNMGKHVAVPKTKVPAIFREATMNAGYVRKGGCFPDAPGLCLWIEGDGDE